MFHVFTVTKLYTILTNFHASHQNLSWFWFGSLMLVLKQSILHRYIRFLYSGKLQVFESKNCSESSSEGHIFLQFYYDFLIFWEKDIYNFRYSQWGLFRLSSGFWHLSCRWISPLWRDMLPASKVRLEPNINPQDIISMLFWNQCVCNKPHIQTQRTTIRGVAIK